MQLTSILAAALPLLALAQDTVSGTTTVTQTSTLTKTVTLSQVSSTVTMVLSANSSSSATGYASNTGSFTAKATGASATGASATTTPIPGVNELGNGAASLSSAGVLAGLAGMLVVALM